jgi:hypothetical protein
LIGWIIGEVLLIDFVTPSSAYWAQGEYLLVGGAMVALALRVAPDGWRGMVHGFLHRQQRAMGAMAHR